MKKILVLLLLVIFITAGCSNNSDLNEKLDTPEKNTDSEANVNNELEQQTEPSGVVDEKDVIEIREKMFIAQIEDIYYNFEDFEGKYIKVEGMYSVVEPEEENQEQVHFVFRNAPGCCGYDGWAGFLLNYDGEYPNSNDWIQVIGTPEIIKNGVFEDLYLNVISIEVMEERGAEYVNQ